MSGYAIDTKWNNTPQDDAISLVSFLVHMHLFCMCKKLDLLTNTCMQLGSNVFDPTCVPGLGNNNWQVGALPDHTPVA